MLNPLIALLPMPQLEEASADQQGLPLMQKRAELRARLDLGRYETDSDAEPAEAKPAGEKVVQAYTSNGLQATVTVAPFSLNSDRLAISLQAQVAVIQRRVVTKYIVVQP